MEFFPYAVNILPLEPGFSGFDGDFGGSHQGRQGAVIFGELGTELVGLMGDAFLLGFNAIPVLVDFIGGCYIHIPEHMGMATDQLVGNAAGDGAEIKVLVVAGHLGLEYHLEQKVAELFCDRILFPYLNSVYHFVGFFNHIGNQTFRGLL